jgi:hypothetical protein
MMSWKAIGRKKSWPNWRYYPGICLEGLSKTTKPISHDTRTPRWDFKPGTRLWRSVHRSVTITLRTEKMDEAMSTSDTYSGVLGSTLGQIPAILTSLFWIYSVCPEKTPGQFSNGTSQPPFTFHYIPYSSFSTTFQSHLMLHVLRN